MSIFKKYYYHYTHQGSVSLVTYQNGTLQQHLQYLPYGGIFVNHRTGSYSSPYTFSAKEKDSESGYTYFGARYYSDNIMQWLRSVDPMSDERPGVSPYSYCQNNPIGRVDMWGMLDEPTSRGGKSMDN
ncbi:MAG: RHS repeat-associated core domain-containing protein [Bacteroidales bacterium]|nr:RHS repeat-associated core domain-containing protein [Bacteroidales bacterium]